jgi:alanine racemase
MVRLGIGLYGIESDEHLQENLKPVSRLKTIVSQVKNIRAGESVGYGRREFLNQDSSIATIAIGYSDGFRRAFSAGAVQLKWKDFKLPVVGNVCMDMTMINVTGTSIEEGDEITIFESASDVRLLAKAAGTIPYEILTGIGHRVKRIYYRE